MKRFGFGAMRLPMLDGEVDKAQFCAMIDEFLAAGFTYFDTAHGYLDGKSELAIRDCLCARYPRESFQLADKLSAGFFKTREEVLPFFEEQLRCTGAGYFDYYLIHAMSAERYDFYREVGAFDIIPQLKREGRVRHFGMSFHDKAEVLDRILTEHPELEFVQLQFNYLDYEDPVVESRKCYEVCVKHGKKVSVMEPVKGGALAELPADAGAILDALGGGSHASYALRFAESFDNVFMVLSGMSTLEQMRDNLATTSARWTTRNSPRFIKSPPPCAARGRSPAPPAATAPRAAPRASTSPAASPASTPSACSAARKALSATRS